MSIWFVLPGAVIATGVVMLASVLRPAPPDLAAVLAGGRDAPAAGPRTLTQRLGGALAVRLHRFPVPHQDLALLGQSVERFWAAKVGYLIAGATVPLAAGLLIGAQPVIPAGAGLVFGAGMFFIPDASARTEGAKRREDFRHALTAYLDLVALERSGEAGPTDALEGAASVSDTWVFARISHTLARAKHAQMQPWAALAELGTQIGVPELEDLADIARLAADEGAAVLQTLTSKAASMRTQALTAARADANGRTVIMSIPVALIAMGFVLLLTWPQLSRMFL